jgi:diguanylate cyclase (GGDEF)-like protein
VDALLDWMLRTAEERLDVRACFAEMGPRLAASDLAIARLSLARIPIFASVDGIQYIWSAESPGEIGVIERQTGFLDDDEHISSPLNQVWQSRRPLRAQLRDEGHSHPLPFLRDLARQGFTDYLALPLDPAGSCSLILSFATRADHGFPEQALARARPLFTVLSLISEAEEAKRLKQLAGRDALTGLANRRAFDLYLRQSWCTCSRARIPLSLILLDIDHFKSINDRFGHNTGDSCIQSVAISAAQIINRDDDLAARIGGEEFAILLPGANDEGTQRIAESIRKHVSHSPWHDILKTHDGTITISLGTGTVIPARDTCQEQFFTAVDNALYSAKQNGRNRVVSSEGNQTPPKKLIR